jgi:phytoene dehydrogenase-like protein
MSDKLRVARLRSQVMRADVDSLFAAPNSSSLEFLRAFGFTSNMIDRFFRPFFGGVFLERELATSSRMLQFVFRMFAAGDTALPAEGMGAIADQLAGPWPQGRIRFHTEVVRIEGTTVTLASGDQLRARAVVVATESQVAAKLVEVIQPPGVRNVTCLYFAGEKPPIEEPILVLDADRQGPVNNLCVPSNVSPTYAPPGGSLISATVLSPTATSDRELERLVRSHLGGWFGSAVDRWKHLRTYRISNALPAIEPCWNPDRPTEPCLDGILPGVYVCGDHRENPSIQGAMASGRRTADQVLADLP